jgi:hypothetical protein
MRSSSEAERFANILEAASRECGGLGGKITEPESQSRERLRKALTHFYTFSFASTCEHRGDKEEETRLHVVTQQNATLNGCLLRLHFARTENAHTRKDVQKELNLGMVTEVRRWSLEEALQRENVTALATGCSAAPSYSLVLVRAASFDTDWMGFRSSSAADAFASALRSLARECGGLRGK